jgi:hypothetical protein
MYGTTSIACQVTFDYNVIFLFIFMIWEVQFWKCLNTVANRNKKKEEEKSKKKQMILYSCSLSTRLLFTFRSSVYLIVPNIFRCIVYLFLFFQVLIHEIQLVRTKTYSLSSSSVFFLFAVKAFWSVYVRMCTTMPSSSSSLSCKPEVSLTRSIKFFFP